MRILYVTAHYPPDFVSGATLQVQRLAEGAARAGHDVAVVSGAIRARLDDGEARVEQRSGVTVHWLGTATRIEQDVDENWRNPAATATVASLLDRWRPDVVHAHALQTLGAELLTTAADRGIPTVVTMHDLWWWCSRLFLVDRALRPCALDTRASSCACARDVGWRLARAAELARSLARVDQVLVPSRALRDVVVANGLAADRVDVDENDVLPTPNAERHVTTPRGGPVRFLYVGGDHPLKGRDVLLGAAKALRRTRGWQLRLHGVAKPRGWWRHVEFAPAYDPQDTAAVMAGADVLVIPSVARESYSLAAREALGAGLAVITSDCLGPEEVVAHRRNGLVVPTGDARALAGAMTSLVEDRALLGRLQDAAREHPPPLRDPDEHVAALVARYRSLQRTDR
jgi:glycosyltransferase involved in cell wall biosynthesis